MIENHFENNTIRCKKLANFELAYFQIDFQPYFKTPGCGAPLYRILSNFINIINATETDVIFLDLQEYLLSFLGVEMRVLVKIAAHNVYLTNV